MITAFFRTLALLALACNPVGWVILFFLSRKRKEDRYPDR